VAIARHAATCGASIRRRVAEALNRLVADPSTGDMIKLQGQDEFRLRVGDWRVLLRRRFGV
jgi:hypothetical protein